MDITFGKHVLVSQGYTKGLIFLPDLKEKIEFIKLQRTFPTSDDLEGASVALLRLQDTYNLETSSIAQGRIGRAKRSTELDAAECFELGRHALANGDLNLTETWTREALRRMEEEGEESGVVHESILEQLAFVAFKKGKW